VEDRAIGNLPSRIAEILDAFRRLFAFSSTVISPRLVLIRAFGLTAATMALRLRVCRQALPAGGPGESSERQQHGERKWQDSQNDLVSERCGMRTDPRDGKVAHQTLKCGWENRLEMND
jgi:hypothetical protein